MWRDDNTVSIFRVRLMLRGVLTTCLQQQRGGAVGAGAREGWHIKRIVRQRGRCSKRFPHLCLYLGLLNELNNTLDNIFGGPSQRARKMVVMDKPITADTDKKLRLMRYNNIRITRPA